ncbi:MAG: hypothetical protein Q8K35_08355 [Thiobacillus sp.]|nr:hypothetical protein [Thiobacillus sp.]MDP2057749.1 hypothetical protein [Thiobacillus sp.]
MRPLADRIHTFGHAMPERHGVDDAPNLRFVCAADLKEQVKNAFRDLERETGPPAYRTPKQCGFLVES